MNIKDAAVIILHNLSDTKNSELLEEMLEYYNKNGIQDLTEKQVLDFLEKKFNIS